MSESPVPLDHLTPPPRRVPSALAARVWLNGFVVAGAVAAGLSSLGLVYAVRHSPLPGDWHLLFDRREAAGQVTRLSRHEHRDRKQGLQVSFTYHYTFQLPDGRHVEGHSTSNGPTPVVDMPRKGKGRPGVPAVPVTVEYHPRHLDANRVKGTRADSGGPFILLGLLLPAVALAVVGFGLWAAWTEYRLLRHGAAAQGYVNACRVPGKRGGSTAQVGDVSVSWGGSENAFLPRADFIAAAHQHHHAALDYARRIAGKFGGCAAGCTVVFALWFAGTFGLVGGAFLGLWLGPMLGFGPNDVLPVFGTAGTCGVLAGTLAAWIALRRHRANVASMQPTDRPAVLDNVECQVTFYLADGETVSETTRTLRLADGPEDEQPRPLLYDPARPSRTRMLEELTPPVRVDEEGAWAGDRPWPVVRAAVVAAALTLPVLAVWWM